MASMIAMYFEMTRKYEEEYGDTHTLVLMQNGAFFEVFGLKNEADEFVGSQIAAFSKLCELAIVDKKLQTGKAMTHDGCRVVNAGFKLHLLDKYLSLLQKAGFTIPVFEEVGEDASTGRKVRELTGVYSSGTSTNSEDVYLQPLNNNICCVWIEVLPLSLRVQRKTSNRATCRHRVHMGVGMVNVFTGETYLCEFAEDYLRNASTFEELGQFLAMHMPTECILVSNVSPKELDDIVRFVQLTSNPLHRVLFGKNVADTPNTLRAANCEKQTYQVQLLSRFYRITDIDVFYAPFRENPFATQAFCFLLDFVHQHSPFLVQKLYEPRINASPHKMVLANHSLKQLNVLSDGVHEGPFSSVLTMLNRCWTPMGRRQFAQQLLNPVTSVPYLQAEYDSVSAVLGDHFDDHCGTVKAQLQNVADLPRILREVIRQTAPPRLLYQLHHSMRIAAHLVQWAMAEEEGGRAWVPYVEMRIQQRLDHEQEHEEHGLGNGLPSSSFLPQVFDAAHRVATFLSTHYLLEECKTLHNHSKIERSFVQRNVSVLLDQHVLALEDAMDKLEALRTCFDSLISRVVETNRPPVTTKSRKSKKTNENKGDNENKEEDNEDDEKELVSIVFTEKLHVSLQATHRRCNLLASAAIQTFDLPYSSRHSAEQAIFRVRCPLTFSKQTSVRNSIRNVEIDALCKTVTESMENIALHAKKAHKQLLVQLQTFQPDMDRVMHFLTILDVLFAKAWGAKHFRFCKPTVSAEETQSHVRAVGLRHCLIENLQQSELYVANNVALNQPLSGDNTRTNSEDKDGHIRDISGILLYGTNAVGKTSIIRALGIAVLLAQAGFFVPATQFSFYPYRSLFTRILGNDNLFEGLSTFAVEMAELRTILLRANQHSLVLGDELCSGTENISAVSLFVAGIQHLAALHCSFVFATHLHEITDLEEITCLRSSVALKHMAVVYDKQRDCLVYERTLQDGPGSNVYGLEVCKSLHLPPAFLEQAHLLRAKYFPETDSLLKRKRSAYNAQHLAGGTCQQCGLRPAVDVHHLVFQQHASEDTGVIQTDHLTFHKNNPANLWNVCQACHDAIHQANASFKKAKTTQGLSLVPLSPFHEK